MKKWQQTLEIKTKTKTKQKNKQTKKTTNEHSQTQWKPTLLTTSNRMVTVDAVKKSWKNAVLAKYAANY